MEASCSKNFKINLVKISTQVKKPLLILLIFHLSFTKIFPNRFQYQNKTLKK
jgi:hypothetical protein